MTEWIRVTRHNPCPCCRKNDWCMIHISGDVAICPRTPDGAIKDLGEAGYLHRLRESETKHRLPREKFPVRPPPPPSNLNWERIVGRCCDDLDPGLAEVAANGLGIKFNTLDRMHMGQDGKDRLTFPMFNEASDPIGIRVRDMDGRKWAYSGSRNGLFIPKRLRGEGVLVICEGPTDTAAMLDLGYDAIGRPSCTGALDMTVKFCQRKDVVIMADADGPGLMGATKLADALWGPKRSVKIVSPPYNKDVREWLKSGATHESVAALIANTLTHTRAQPTPALSRGGSG